MLLRCPKCTSKYKVKDDIITAEGIKAKCYKCGSIFFVKKREAVELNNIVSSLKENISKWEERAMFDGAGGGLAPSIECGAGSASMSLHDSSRDSKQEGQGTETGNNGSDVKEDKDGVGELLNEIESDILKEKALPGEERLKDILNEGFSASVEKSAEDELSVFTEDIASSVAAEPEKDEPHLEDAGIDEFLNELEEKKSEEGDGIENREQTSDIVSQISPVESTPQTTEPELDLGDAGFSQNSAAVEEEKEAEPAIEADLPIFQEQEFVPLDADIKTGGILSQEEMDKLLAGSLSTSPENSAIEADINPPAAPPAQAGGEGEIDLDKLMEDTAVEMNIGDAQRESAVSGEAVPEPSISSEFDDVMKKASESLDGTMVSSENLETEARRPVSDTAEDTSPIDVMADMEEEFKPKGSGFFGKIMENVRLSSYLSKLQGRFLKKGAQQDIDRFASLTTGLTEEASADQGEAPAGKRKITWKLIILSLIMLAILAAGTLVIVVVAKKWMSGVKEKEEIVAVKERPSPKPRIEEKKVEEPVKPLETEKPAEMEKKPAAGEANLTESQQPSQAETQTASTPPAPPVPEERLARLGIILPISFSSEENKVMTMNVKLELENKESADIIKKNPMYYEGILEDSVDQFFRDKFYEDTHFVREKLKEVVIRNINENMKNGRVKKVDIEELKVK